MLLAMFGDVDGGVGTGGDGTIVVGVPVVVGVLTLPLLVLLVDVEC